MVGIDRLMSSTSGRLGIAAPNDSRSTSMDESREASRSSGELGDSSDEQELIKESKSNSLREIFSDIHSMSMNASPAGKEFNSLIFGKTRQNVYKIKPTEFGFCHLKIKDFKYLKYHQFCS